MAESLIGARLPRIDAVAQATGEAKFTSDIVLPRMLHGKILRSPLPHARVLNVDTSRAERHPGVKAVVTGRDTAGITYGYLGVSERFKDKRPLTTDKVRFIGDEIAAVAAIDEDTALEALDRILVDFEELPAVYDAEAAMDPGAPRVHDSVERNISRVHRYHFGDVEEGFRDAYHIREDHFVTQLAAHATLETHIAVSSYDSSGGLTVWSSTQSPFAVQQDLAMTLQMPRAKVRVIKPHMGGGFGAKGDGMDTPDFCASLLSIKTGRPVRVGNYRDEEFMVTRRRHPALIYLRTGVARDGTLLAMDCRVMSDGGAYYSQGAIAPLLFGSRLHVPYRQKAVRYEGYRIYTNKPPCGAMRGFTAPQMHFAQDVHLDLIARDLGIDPWEIRLKNGLESGETALADFYVSTSAFKQSVERVVESPRRKAGLEREGNLAAWGMGSSSFPCGAFFRLRPGTEAFSGVNVEAHPDGTATIFAGAADVGQGSNTLLTQFVAEALAIPMASVRIISADTALTPLDFGTYASRVTLMAGSAALEAVAQVKAELMEAAAQALEANPADLELAGGRIGVKGSPDRGMSIAEAVQAAHKISGGKAVLGRGRFIPATKETPHFSFGTSGAEVEIDVETGQVSIRKITTAHDCGIAINPMAVEGQLQGSIHMAIGYSLSEEVEMEGGQTLNPSLVDYKIPTPLEMPDVDVLFLNVPDPAAPLGAKEAGEGTVGPNVPAIANAIYEASGVQMHSLPISPEKMLNALEERNARP
ncbi:MAG TPA: molybdopterin cofactor-binding domain-containing protein [Dehalococcoidia bacterium]|nr:molybdopterin cofactor-binding domain-containing protein [Dehalococcoidia bacterium]